ncbi:MAG: hypothetical protein LUE63_07695 [Lachnospiraceae bacterium]|nr:hypothetical protein [Lachnospiraceae bacterium]
MEKKEEFRAGLTRLREKAAGNYNHITIGEILACFSGMELTKDQIRLIYQYAEEEHIVIEGYQPHDTRSVSLGEPKLTGEEKAYFKMYLEDLKGVVPCEIDEAAMLAERLLAGDDAVITRLTEGHLHLVLEIARRHSGRGVLMGDLVQEGNMALVLALDELVGGTRFLAGDIRDFLTDRVETALKAWSSDQGKQEQAGEQKAREANRLLAATAELEEELGREATLAELSRKVNLPEDKVKELIRISLNAAEFSQNAGEGESSSED